MKGCEDEVEAPKVAIVLDKERHMSLSLGSLVDFEDITGASLFTLQGELTAAQLRALLYVALKADDPGLTVEQVGQIVQMSDTKRITDALGQLMGVSLPLEDAEAGDGGNLSRPTGT